MLLHLRHMHSLGYGIRRIDSGATHLLHELDDLQALHRVIFCIARVLECCHDLGDYLGLCVKACLVLVAERRRVILQI